MKPFDWRPHLQPDEVLLWQGRPHPALPLVRPRQTEWLIGALGAVGAGALIVADRALPHAREGSARPVLFLALLLAAVLVCGIPFRAMRLRSRALKRIGYALTDRRMLRADPAATPRVASTPLPRRARPVIEPEPHGLATLHFGPGTLRFQHLPNAAAVAKLAQAVT